MAGLWERWEKGDRRIETFTILTTSANEDVRDLHDRMPVVLEPSDWSAWLRCDDAEEAEAMLGPARVGALVVRPISTRINSPANDSPEACEPVDDATSEPGEPKGLFD
jgi:putative SOS response-associated peptidase YedK